jgi:cytochrome d ubiquinol oxidase subunit I
MAFYSFHIMVLLGGLFFIIFILSLIWAAKNTIEKKRWFLVITIIAIPLVYIASMSGWILAEVGRQPWVIQDLMPTIAAVTDISSTSVKITFWLFAVLFTTLLIAEVKIMLTQIKKGPKDGGK